MERWCWPAITASSPKTFANLTQARRWVDALAKSGQASHVSQFGRPFYVVLDDNNACPRCSDDWSRCYCGKVDIVTGESANAGLVSLPGYRRLVEGGNRGDMQDANRAAGRACYCASLWSGFCDCCTGLAPVGGERWNALLAEPR